MLLGLVGASSAILKAKHSGNGAFIIKQNPLKRSLHRLYYLSH